MTTWKKHTIIVIPLIDCIIFYVGAWDYVHMHDDRSTPPPDCSDPKYKQLSDGRGSSGVAEIFLQMGLYAKRDRTHLVYRNNHINIRFDAECGDHEVERIVRGEISDYNIF